MSSLRSLLPLALLLVGCASVQTSPRERGEQSRLTRADLDEGGSTIVTALDAVRVLRPMWLNPPRGRVASSHVAGSAGSVSAAAGHGGVGVRPVIYIDGVRQTDVEALQTVPVLRIIEMRYLDQNRSVQMHGPGHEAGTIEVTTVDGRHRP